ncbi:hypothetical protein [Hafnia psychrotolerans]|uniref:Uncharacterized protein n=1 Tax=Hafnia psychrotolerans TaxID=1477018 RepID=A0ABQ1G7X2_9GAMM|nr:hypothetical protein [Hafnia psychrotolerans]GGA38490.1 hypothetical protein GCM10011328_11660 [Hafnia psychrotolerans]
MYEVKNLTVLFLEDDDFQNPNVTIGSGALKENVDKASLDAEVMIYKNVIIKNRFGNAAKFPFIPSLPQ